MTLSIVQRIKAGFALLLLLLILGGISYLQTTGIHNQLKQVTEKATPLAMTTTRLREALLLANRLYPGSSEQSAVDGATGIAPTV